MNNSQNRLPLSDPAFPRPTGLYHSENEHDACGVGLIADINNVPQHRIVEKGISILKRLKHRGAAGNDPLTGDGAGILTVIPDDFFRRAAGFDLPPAGRYAVAMIFGGGDLSPRCKIVASEGGRVLGIREVPTFPDQIGEAARRQAPEIRQLFVDG